jgi:PKD repeat protein
MKKYILSITFFIATLAILKSQTLNYYYGNLHAHTSYSDGNKDSATSLLTKPIQGFNYAKNSQHIDFYGISEHNHLNAGLYSPSLYHQGMRDAKAATIDGSFVALYGMEYGVIANGGHVLVYGYDSLLIGWDNSDFDVFNSEFNYATLWKTLNKKSNSFACFAHPTNSDYDSIYYKTYNAAFDSAIVGTPFRSGPAFSTNTTYSNPSTSTYISQYNLALKKGYHVGIGLDHDTHNSVFGRQTMGRLVIMAPALTQNDLFNSMKSMRFYGSDDWNAKVNFTVNGQVMGSVFTHSGTATASVTVTDPDGESTSNITLFYGVPGSGAVPVTLSSSTGLNTLTFTHNLANNTTYYYYLKINQTDGDVIYTSPIWYTRNDAINVYPPVSTFSTSSSMVCPFQAVSLTDNSTNTPTSWFWSMPGAIPSTSTLQNPVINYNTSGTKNITLITTNASGSSAPITKTITVNTCTQIQETKTANDVFTVYPNPANNLVSILFNNDLANYSVKLVDILGKEIVIRNNQKTNSSIDLKDLNEGIYFIIITDSNNNSFSKHIVVNHY